MKNGFYVIILMTFFCFGIFHSQTVSLTTSNLGCKNTGIVTASTSAILSPTFQLQLSDGTVIAPVAGNNTVFTNSNIFNSLATGTYRVVARDNLGVLFTSANVSVTDGYTNMNLTANAVSLNCIGGTKTVPVSLTGGKAPYTYQISDSSSFVLQTSTITSATSFTFNALPQGNYTVSVTDACGVTTVSNVSVNNPSVTVNDLSVSILVQGFPGNCGRSRMFIPSGFTKSGVALSATERSLFSYKIKFNGNLYGVDTSGDGFPDLNTGGIALNAFILQNLPIAVTRLDHYNASTRPTVVVSDQCGNTKEFTMNISKDAITASIDCTLGGRIRPTLQASLLCLPVNWTFTNTSNPSNVLQFTQTSDGQVLSGFTLGATYNIAYADSNGDTNLVNYGFSNMAFTVPSSPILTTTASITKNSNYAKYGSVTLSVGSLLFGESYNFEVTASNNTSVAVGFTGSATQGAVLPRPNTSAPLNNWPDGTYTLKITTPCGNSNVTFTVSGYNPVISGNTITSVCGGFSYIMNGTFNPSTDFRVDIISGPSNVGATQTLSSATASNLFTNLSYGTYTAGIRTATGTLYMGTQTFSFGENGVIKIDRDNSGGFVCTSGAADGTLTIIASTISPSPNDILEYRLSLDGGITYGAWQTSNIFTGLTNIIYTYQVKDGCGFVVADNIQIGSVSSPQASASVGAVCELDKITVIQLGVDTANATYLWTGPGINSTNMNLRNPVLNIDDLQIGNNNYTVTVTSSFCSISSSANTTITKLSSTRPKAATGIELPSIFGISTQGSTMWLNNTKNGAMVLESSNKGMVITRLKTIELPTGSNAVKGMIVYDTDSNCVKLYNGTSWKCIGRICP